MSSVLINIVIGGIGLRLLTAVVLEVFKPQIKALGRTVRRKPFESTVIVGLLSITILLIVMMRS